MNKPAPITEYDVQQVITRQRDCDEMSIDDFIFARAIEAARDAQWEAMLAGQKHVATVTSNTGEYIEAYRTFEEQLPAGSRLYAAPVAAQERHIIDNAENLE